MRENNLFSKHQYGFVDRRSTTLQLLYILDEWTKILDEGGTVDIVYMDFMKAFDKVPHERLFSKLSAYGIGGEILAWIRSFLTNRKQRVRVGEATSEWKEVTSGIPQGSVLGPILFVLYINDMPESIQNNSTVKMFVDDSKLYKRTDGANGASDLQKDLDKLYDWSNKWLLKFHPEKMQSSLIKQQAPGRHPSASSLLTTPKRNLRGNTITGNHQRKRHRCLHRQQIIIQRPDQHQHHQCNHHHGHYQKKFRLPRQNNIHAAL